MANNFLNCYDDILQNMNSQKILYGILLLSLLVFSPVFTESQFLTYDDNWYIYENENVINLSWKSIVNIFTTLQGGQYSPLGEVYHSILYYLFGKNATAFKICAFFIHLLNVVLLFKVFIKLFDDKMLVATVVLIFAIHPLQVETIGWISVIFRNAVFLMLLGYFFYIKYLESGNKIIKLLPVLICFLFAFLTKEQAILFPIGLFLISLIKLDSIKSKRFLLEMLFWAGIVLVFGLITIEITKTGGPSIVDRSVSVYDKIGLLSKTIIGYGYNFLFPLELSFSYPYPLEGVSTPFYYILFVVGLLLAGVYLSFINNLFRVGFLWFFGFLSLGLAFAFFHLRDSFMADRYAYVAIIGFAIMFYLMLKFIQKILGNNKPLFLIILSFFILIFSYQSFNRVFVFKNSKNIWSQAIKVNPNNQYAYNSLGFYFRNQNKLDTALTLYKKSIEIAPKYYLAYSNIGKVYYGRKEYDSALYYVSKAILYNPGYQKGYENRAAIYFKTKQKDSLLFDLDKIILLDPDNSKYLVERSKVYFEKKQYEKAIKDLEKAVEIDVNNDYAYYLVGHCNMLLKNYVKAYMYLNKAIDLKTNNPNYYYIRSLCQTNIKQYSGALKDALKAKQLGFKINDQYITVLKMQAVKEK